MGNRHETTSILMYGFGGGAYIKTTSYLVSLNSIFKHKLCKVSVPPEFWERTLVMKQIK